MPTQCSQDSLDFGTVEGRQVVASFDGGSITSDAGALLLGATDKAIGLVERFAACFIDARSPELIEHSLETLVGQRLFGLALGYEDLNDHDHLRNDPVMAVLAGKLESRRQACAPVAGKSTLNRLEQALRGGVGRYHRIGHDDTAIEALFVTLFLDAHTKPPKRIILDLDATDDPLHGHQEGRFFHGYYDGYCYLPLYITCGRHLIAAKLRRADIDASAGATEEVARIVAQVRARWPKVEIIIGADSGFARDQLMSWCEENRVEYVLGFARNGRLVANIEHEMVEARAEARDKRARTPLQGLRLDDPRQLEPRAPRHRQGRVDERQGQPAFRRHLAQEARRLGPLPLREGLLRPRRPRPSPGQAMENRIKECQTDMFADRTPASTMRTNQLRLWFASMAYVLMCALRRIGLAGTELAQATCGTTASSS